MLKGYDAASLLWSLDVEEIISKYCWCVSELKKKNTHAYVDKA